MIESALVVLPQLTYALLKPAYSSSYGLIQNERFAKLQFRSLRIKTELFDEYYRDTCRITKENMVAFLQANAVYFMKKSLKSSNAAIHIFCSEKETRSMQISAKKLHANLTNSYLHKLQNLFHGEFSLNHAEQYVKECCANSAETAKTFAEAGVINPSAFSHITERLAHQSLQRNRCHSFTPLMDSLAR